MSAEKGFAMRGVCVEGRSGVELGIWTCVNIRVRRVKWEGCCQEEWMKRVCVKGMVVSQGGLLDWTRGVDWRQGIEKNRNDVWRV